MNQYEVMYIIDTALEDQARADLIERFSNLVSANGGQVDRIDEWGKRRLAYPINYKTDGYYVLMYITAPSDLPKEIERNFKITETILRYLVIRFEGELPTKREMIRPAPVAQAADFAQDAPTEDAPAEEIDVVEATDAAEVADAAEQAEDNTNEEA